MSTTSTNFSFVIATTSDVVNVVTQIANNFSSVDSIVGAEHTGTGSHKAGIRLTSPILVNPAVTGTVSGPAMVSAQTGSFQTITATGGILAVSSVTAAGVQIGTYSMPATIGVTGEILSVLTGNAVWASNTPGTGAAEDLSNLSSVAINTNLGTFAAGKVTIAEVIATSGTVSGLASVSATTGTFSANLTVVGTLSAGVVNCTGGAITAGGISIGTYSLPATVGSAGQVLSVVTGNALFTAVPASTNRRSPIVFEWHGGYNYAGLGKGIFNYSTAGFMPINIAKTATGNTQWLIAGTGAAPATAETPVFYTKFYRASYINTLEFNFVFSCNNNIGGNTCVGQFLVAVGTASTLISYPSTTAANAVAYSTSGQVDVSALATDTVHTMTISIGLTGTGQNSLAVCDVVGYIIS